MGRPHMRLPAKTKLMMLAVVVLVAGCHAHRTTEINDSISNEDKEQQIASRFGLPPAALLQLTQHELEARCSRHEKQSKLEGALALATMGLSLIQKAFSPLENYAALCSLGKCTRESIYTVYDKFKGSCLLPGTREALEKSSGLGSGLYLNRLNNYYEDSGVSASVMNQPLDVRLYQETVRGCLHSGFPSAIDLTKRYEGFGSSAVQFPYDRYLHEGDFPSNKQSCADSIRDFYDEKFNALALQGKPLDLDEVKNHINSCIAGKFAEISGIFARKCVSSETRQRLLSQELEEMRRLQHKALFGDELERVAATFAMMPAIQSLSDGPAGFRVRIRREAIHRCLEASHKHLAAAGLSNEVLSVEGFSVRVKERYPRDQYLYEGELPGMDDVSQQQCDLKVCQKNCGTLGHVACIERCKDRFPIQFEDLAN